MERELAYPTMLKDGLRPLTRDEFDAFIYQNGSLNKSLLDTYLGDAADAYGESHPVLKIIKDFVPVLGIATDLLEAYKTQKERHAGERLHDVVYHLCNAYIELNLKVLDHRINIEHIKQQFPALVEAYIDYSMEAYQLEKIEYFKNIFVNGVIDFDRKLDEKINIFNIIASLTIGEIEILKIFYEHPASTHSTSAIGIDELSSKVTSDKAYLKQLCSNLVGKGLLAVDGLTSTWAGQVNGHYKSEYVDRLIKYITDNS